MIDRYLESMILKQRGQNQKLAQEILKKLSPESKERLYRLLQDMESEVSSLNSRMRRLYPKSF